MKKPVRQKPRQTKPKPIKSSIFFPPYWYLGTSQSSNPATANQLLRPTNSRKNGAWGKAPTYKPNQSNHPTTLTQPNLHRQSQPHNRQPTPPKTTAPPRQKLPVAQSPHTYLGGPWAFYAWGSPKSLCAQSDKNATANQLPRPTNSRKNGAWGKAPTYKPNQSN